MSEQLAKSMKQDLITVETQIQTLLDRIMSASSTSVVGAYENRIGQLEQKKLELTQKCAQNGQVLKHHSSGSHTALARL